MKRTNKIEYVQEAWRCQACREWQRANDPQNIVGGRSGMYFAICDNCNSKED